MFDKNGKKVVYYCSNCSRVYVFDEWIVPDAEARKAIQKQRQIGNIKFVKSVCDTCLGLSR